MILSYKPQFVQPILDGTKIHTLRLDPHRRWKPGMNIQFYEGNPRNGGKQFHEGVCKGVQEVQIQYDGSSNQFRYILVDGLYLHDFHQLNLARNDGFGTMKDFWTLFSQPFEGVIIHFSDFRY